MLIASLGFQLLNAKNSDISEKPYVPGTPGYNNPKPQFNRWSLALSLGTAILDGDIPMTKTKIWPASDMQFALNGQVAYAISPVWSLFLQYDYTPLKGTMLFEDINVDYDFKSITHDVYIGGNFNILNLFNTNRRINRWSLGVNVGFGVTVFNTNAISNIDIDDRDGSSIVKKDDPYDKYSCKGEYALTIPLGVNVEFAATKWLGLFLEARYKMSQTDLYDGWENGKSRDNVIYFGAGVRYKIGGSSKTRSFVGNLTTNEYNPSIARQMAEENSKNIDILARQIVVMNNRNSDSDSYAYSPKIYELNDKISQLEGIVNKLVKEVQAGEDGKTGYVGSVYYGLNEFNLDQYSETIILAVAKQLYQNADLNLVIESYGDNSGSDEVNQKLCARRAQVIKDVMINEYGISETRITVEIKGKVTDSEGKLKLNRRCDLIIKK